MVGILAIGTEITTGQILNTNSQWLSTQLLELGIQTSYQMAVPDSPQEIKEALDFLEKHSSLIIITGGLGPTADDFTRKVLAEKYHKSLQWNEENWQRVQAKLNSRGVQIRIIHRQQCEFLEGSTLLKNNVGIADGFTFKVSLGDCGGGITPGREIDVYVLPGPPKEILSIWQNEVRDRLQAFIPESEKWIQKKWTTKGLPESEVASLINEALGEASQRVLYRAHTPFIDVKLLYQKQDEEINEVYGQKISQVLAPWFYNDEEVKN